MNDISNCFELAIKFFNSLLHEGIGVAAKRAKNKLLTKLQQKQIMTFNQTNVRYKYRKGYHSIYQPNEILPGKPAVKVLAFYLPQFHTFPENDLWWGKGFTEWTNTRKSLPRFEKHYQPREPHDDIGYYDLACIDTLEKQVKLAQEHHIYGFCFYYYWFSGHRLMEKPIDFFLENKDIQLPFCLCWANENWTRAWDGLNTEVLIKQDYSINDRKKFILDIKKYLLDERYIRIQGKPVIIVYNPGQIPEVRDVFKSWQEAAKECGIGEVVIWIVRSFNNTIHSLNLEGVVNREIEFPPHLQSFVISLVEKETDNDGGGHVFDYAEFVSKVLDGRSTDSNIYRTVMLGWDNSARRKNGYTVFDNFDLKIYYDWLRENLKEAENKFEPEEMFTFINAWNEWAEGTYLEPDKKYGYANINTTARAILNIPLDIKESDS